MKNNEFLIDLNEERYKIFIYAHAYNSHHQILLTKKSFNIINTDNVRLLVIDSIIGHFRSEYGGRSMLAIRQQAINRHMHDLSRLCDIFPYLTIVITNQVTAKLDGFNSNKIIATGGNIIAHCSTTRTQLRKGKGLIRIARIVDAPHLPEGEAILNITENGIL